MIWSPVNEDRNLLYALSWNYAQDAKFAFDAQTRTILDLNPAAEELTGYSRVELLEMRAEMLYPESEKDRLRSLFRDSGGDPGAYPGYHIRCKDGRVIPVLFSSSATWALSGKTVWVGVFRDITQLVANQNRLAAQNWALNAYAGAALALGQAASPQGLLRDICEAIVRESAYLAAWVGVAEDAPGKPIRVAASAGDGASYLNDLRLSWSVDEPEGRGPTGVCVRTGTVQILSDAETSPAYEPWRERAQTFGIRSSISIPIAGDIGWKGALIVYSSRANAFEGESVEVFVRLAGEMVHGLRALNREELLKTERQNLARTQAELTMALSGMVGPIIAAMEMRDPYTAGHQGRVAEIACAISEQMGWPEDQRNGLRLAALVHDIGKISIPAEILTKPGRLNAAEQAIIRMHPQTAYSILKDVPFAWPVADIVLQHHERLDGSGYPAGLTSEQILPESKVLAVADMVEAMASYRPYRPGHELASVLRHVESEAGTMLDSDAVKTCVTLFRDRQIAVTGWTRSMANVA